jgi:ATP-dependent RNA helicase DDX54/DBP10
VIAKDCEKQLFSAIHSISRVAIMPSRRAASPAASEPELDILDSLYPGEGENGGQSFGADGEDGLDFDGFLHAGAGGDGEDDDEAFIALQQAASYRKASNLKGRTVKKGGGFQAMGKRKAASSR